MDYSSKEAQYLCVLLKELILLIIKLQKKLKFGEMTFGEMIFVKITLLVK
jgi:hypothetical protein